MIISRLVYLLYVVANKLSTLSTPNKIIVSLLLEHLSITEELKKNSGSPEVGNYRGDRGSIVGGTRGRNRGYHSLASPLKGTSQESSKEALPTGLAELDKLIREYKSNPKYIFRDLR